MVEIPIRSVLKFLKGFLSYNVVLKVTKPDKTAVLVKVMRTDHQPALKERAKAYSEIKFRTEERVRELTYW